MLLAATGAIAQTGPASEYQLKAVFLLNFGRFVAWPPTVFPTPTSPFIIGVLGTDPFGDALDQAVRGETIEGHPLAVRRHRRVSEAADCHILFIGGSEAGHVDDIVAALAGRPVLTVCDADGAAWHDVMIHFRTENRRIRLQINLAAAKAADLTISSKLLRPAEIVTLAEDRR
ncbi:MAG TPA: YfiR family protein [Lacunisphaera sp.]|nr:YfiR family protein [Lacunisphaera sp.]